MIFFKIIFSTLVDTRGMLVNKQEIAAYVAEQCDLSTAVAQKAVDAFCEAIIKCLQNKEDAKLVGFGTFSASARAAREGRNPQTGAALKIAASTQAKFKPGQALKDALNGTTTATKTKTTAKKAA